MIEPIDVVITWVDGYDPVHQAKLNKYLLAMGGERPESAAPTRFNSCGELDYCVRSIMRYAPWVRTIYIVTDAQVPTIIQAVEGTPFEGRVILVDHRDIFVNVEQCLPTFNSLSIESVLWRIKGLSNRFIYFNDDTFLVRPVVEEDFFKGDTVILRGEWKTMSDRKWRSVIRQKLSKLRQWLGIQSNVRSLNAHRQLQENSAKLMGQTKRFFHLHHAPCPLKKSTFEHFFASNPNYLEENTSYRLRDPQQFWPIAVANYLEMQQETAQIDNTLKAVMVNGACHSMQKIKQRLVFTDKDARVAFMCMQSLDEAPAATQTMLLRWILRRVFPDS